MKKVLSIVFLILGTAAAALAQGYALAHGEGPEPLPRNRKEFFALVDAGDLAAVRVLV